MYVFSLIYIYIDIESFPFFSVLLSLAFHAFICFFLEEVPWVQVADPRGGKRWLENSATTFGGTCLGKGTQDMPTTYLYRMRSVMFYHFIFLIFLIRIYYIYAIFKIKVKVMAYILHIYIYVQKFKWCECVSVCVLECVCLVFINVCNRSDIFGNPRCRVAEA